MHGPKFLGPPVLLSFYRDVVPICDHTVVVSQCGRGQRLVHMLMQHPPLDFQLWCDELDRCHVTSGDLQMCLPVCRYVCLSVCLSSV